MNATLRFGSTLAVCAVLAVAPAALAQQHNLVTASQAVVAAAPVAQTGSSGLAFPEPAQQSTTAPTAKVVRGSGNWDAQAPPPPPPPAPPAPPAPPSQAAPVAVPKVQMPTVQMPKGQLVNVKVEFTITDQIGTKPPTKKTMTLLIADRENGRIRTRTDYPVPRGNSVSWDNAPLSVDVFPMIEGSKVRLEFSLEYTVTSERDPALPADAQGPKTNVSERLAVVLESGVPLTIAQSSDAVTDRKVTIEVKATVVK